MELFAGSQAVIKFNRRRVQLANQKLYARRVAIADIKQNKGNRQKVWRGSKRRVVPSSGRNPLVPVREVGSELLKICASARITHELRDSPGNCSLLLFNMSSSSCGSSSSTFLVHVSRSTSLSLASRKLEVQIILYAQHAGTGYAGRQAGWTG